MRGTGVVAVLTLALGIGATTTMASVAYATLFRRVPFPEADRLVSIYNVRDTPRDGVVRLRWSYPHIVELRQAATSFESLASFSSTIATVQTADGAERFDGEVVSPEYFTSLRIVPVLGRIMAQSDAGQPVALISEPLWRTRFNADSHIIGTALTVNDIPVTVIGVIGNGNSGVSGRASLWLPTWMAPRMTYGEYLTSPQHFISVVARLKPGVSIDTANAELTAIGARFHDDPVAVDAKWGATAVSLTDARVDPTSRRSVTLLFSAAGCLLIIACVNVAGLILARARGRQREMAVRLAIGASRAQLIRQLLLEGLVLSIVAGTGGALLAVWCVRIVGGASPTFIASWQNDYGAIGTFADVSFDFRMLLFALLLTIGTGLACSLAPAFSTSRPQWASGLRQGDRGATGRHRGLTVLVVTEVALAVLLLSGAAFLIDGFTRLQQFHAGFDADRVLTFWMRPPISRYPPETGPATLERFLTAIESTPGVESAAVNRCVPFTGCSRTSLRFTDRPNEADRAPVIGRHYISATYFDTLGIPLRAGRRLTTADRAGSQPVTVINETAARRFWPSVNPIGQHVRFGSTTGFTDPAHPVEIVGIVGDVKYEGPDQPIGPDFYTSYLQFAYPDSMVMVKAQSASTSLLPDLRAAVAAVDPTVPIYDVMALDERVSRAIGRPRFNMSILTLFGGAALVLAALGVYGLLSFTVSSRLREIGVRLALGAAPSQVMRAMVTHGVQLASIGIAMGLAVAYLLTRVAQTLVADLGTTKPSVLIAVSVAMAFVAAAAAFLPARRASAVDPIVVLRND